MGCAESMQDDDIPSVTQNTIDIDSSRMTPRATNRPIGFSRVAETRLRLQQQQEAEDHHGSDTIPPLSPRESCANMTGLGPAAGAPPNPLNSPSRSRVVARDSAVSPMDSATSMFSSDEPPAADQQTVAFVNDDVLSQYSLASSAPVLSANNSHNGSPEFSTDVDNHRCCLSEDAPSPLPKTFP